MSSDMPEPRPAEPAAPRPAPPLTVIPVRPPAPPSPLRAFVRWLFRTAFGVSLGINLLLLFLVLSFLGDGSNSPLHERYQSGASAGSDRVAVIHVEGVLMEGMTDFARKQIEQAAEDNRVKAVVVRINSPGGTITASDDLHRRLVELRNGNPARGTQAKPLVVSMGSMAASGGYYIAMPASRLVAERTTITGSIGVYAAFPNVSKLADKYGVEMNVIKAGEVKDSGSMFKEMSPQERQLWQDMVDDAYRQFLAVVEEGRPALKGKLRDVVIDRPIPAPSGAEPAKEGKGEVEYVRRRADGGIYTADKAKELGLIDQIGYLDDALAEARKAANLPDDCKVITYDRPQSVLGAFLGARAPEPAMQVDPGRLASAASPRLWYLAPQSELAGILAALGSR